MASGGYRAGAGRPRGSTSKKLSKKDVKVIKKSAKLSGITPLEYMLEVMNSTEADDERRDRMAIAAAPYVHEKAADKKLGKKEQKLESAKKAENVFTAQRKIPNSKPQIVVNNS